MLYMHAVLLFIATDMSSVPVHFNIKNVHLEDQTDHKPSDSALHTKQWADRFYCCLLGRSFEENAACLVLPTSSWVLRTLLFPPPPTLKKAHICHSNVPLLLQEFWCCTVERQHCTQGWVSCLKKIKQTEAINPVLSSLFRNVVPKYFPMQFWCLSIILRCVWLASRLRFCFCKTDVY